MRLAETITQVSMANARDLEKQRNSEIVLATHIDKI